MGNFSNVFVALESSTAIVTPTASNIYLLDNYRARLGDADVYLRRDVGIDDDVACDAVVDEGAGIADFTLRCRCLINVVGKMEVGCSVGIGCLPVNGAVAIGHADGKAFPGYGRAR